MMINTEHLVAMTEANQNFSKVTRLVDDNGLAVILKNNKPRYVLVDFSQYDELEQMRQMRAQKIHDMAESIIDENLDAFLELAK